MHAHKVRVHVTDSRELRVKLPSDFPPGEAEVVVTAGEDRGAGTRAKGQGAAREFRQWLDALLKRLPEAPVLPPDAMDRGQIYDE